MTNSPPPPRRNYAQMVRVVRDELKGAFKAQVPYQLANAYSFPSTSSDGLLDETRIRTLDELGMNTRPVNQLQNPGLESYYSQRESTILYHELSEDQQQYFEGVNPNPAPTRLDARPGTKSRAYLGSDTAAEKINVAEQRSVTASSSSATPSKKKPSRSGSIDSTRVHPGCQSNLATSSTPLNLQPIEASAPKQTRLPYVQHASLEGIAPTPLGFCLTF